MSKFKYSANINGSIVNKQRFVQDLEARGYTWEGDYLKYEDDLCVNSSIRSTQLPNGCYRSGSDPRSRDYTFNINTPDQYDTALAILSMKDDELFYTGELVEILAAGGWGYSNSNNGCIGMVLKTNQQGFNNNCIGATQNVVFKTLNPKHKDCYTDEADAPNLAYDKPVFRKLTAEEVINFYKTQSMQEKKLIGYKLKNDCNQYKQAVLIILGHSKLVLSPEKTHFKIGSISYDNIVNANVLDLWFEPVYEDLKPSFKSHMLESGFTVTIHKTGEVVTNDGTFTIKELDTKFGICFRGTKFNKWDMSVTEAKYKIGCQVVTHTDIIGINELYKELNK